MNLDLAPFWGSMGIPRAPTFFSHLGTVGKALASLAIMSERKHPDPLVEAPMALRQAAASRHSTAQPQRRASHLNRSKVGRRTSQVAQPSASSRGAGPMERASHSMAAGTRGWRSFRPVHQLDGSYEIPAHFLAKYRDGCEALFLNAMGLGETWL
jgi:hypothetical protein